MVTLHCPLKARHVRRLIVGKGGVSAFLATAAAAISDHHQPRPRYKPFQSSGYFCVQWVGDNLRGNVEGGIYEDSKTLYPRLNEAFSKQTFTNSYSMTPSLHQISGDLFFLM